MKCARAGHWGGTIPEFLDWYRRRPSHHDRWSNWDGDVREKEFRNTLSQRYPGVWLHGIPTVTRALPRVSLTRIARRHGSDSAAYVRSSRSGLYSTIR